MICPAPILFAGKQILWYFHIHPCEYVFFGGDHICSPYFSKHNVELLPKSSLDQSILFQKSFFVEEFGVECKNEDDCRTDQHLFLLLSDYLATLFTWPLDPLLLSLTLFWEHVVKAGKHLWMISCFLCINLPVAYYWSDWDVYGSVFLY